MVNRKLLRQETQDSAFSEETPRPKVRGTLSRHDHLFVLVVATSKNSTITTWQSLVIIDQYTSTFRQETAESSEMPESPIHKPKHCRLQLPE